MSYRSPKFIVAFLFLLFINSFSYAQVYPVVVNTSLRPPYSLNLSDYANPVYDRIQTSLFMADLTKVNYAAKVRLVIRGAGGINISTLPGQEIGPVFLNGGQSITLTGAELNQLFNTEKLQFSGITYQQYKQNAALPEGIYQFHFEVLDYNLSVPVSNTNSGFATAWLVLNDPPIINKPENFSTIAPLPQQNIFFQWTPRHTGSPNSAFTTVYDIQMVEIYPAGRNPNDAMLTSPPIFEKTVYSTSYNYNIMDPYLFPGKSYAFRVRARDLDNRDLFKNQGYSEVYSFYYGDPCLVPADIRIENIDAQSVLLYWSAPAVNVSTEIFYKRQSGGSWASVTSFTGSAGISNLLPGEAYLFKLKGICQNNASLFTDEIIYSLAGGSGSGTAEACDLPLEENVQAVATTLNQVAINWKTQAWFDDYIFRYRILGSHYFSDVNSKNASLVLENLELEEVYEYQIQYHCTEGQWVDGVYNTFRITPAVIVPGAVTGDCFPPVDLSSQVNADLSATISWPKDKEAASFRIYWRIKGTMPWDSLSTSKITTDIKPLLEKTIYEYKVHEVCKSGGLSIASDVKEFNTSSVYSYPGQCEAPDLGTPSLLSSMEAKLLWLPKPHYTGYLIEYRKEGSSLGWMSLSSKDTFKIVSHLEVNAQYEYRVQAHCGVEKQSDFSVIGIFSTSGKPEEPFVCGDNQGLINITNRVPISTMKVGDTFTAADFEMTISSLTSGSPYKGLATAKIPYLKHSTFVFGMMNVQINDEKQMFAGSIYLQKANLTVMDPKMAATIRSTMAMVDQSFEDFDRYLATVDRLQDQYNDYISTLQGGTNTGSVKSGDLVIAATLTVAVSKASQITGTAGADGACVLSIKGDDGSTVSTTVTAPAIIKDSEGALYSIDNACKATFMANQISLNGTDLTTISDRGTVTFVEHSGQRFGFAEWNSAYTQSNDWASRHPLLGSSYRVSAKAIEPNATDVVKATITTSDLDKTKLVFATGTGVKFNYTRSGNDYLITVVGGPADDAQELYALYPEGDSYITLGKLLIASYKHKRRKVILVPVNGASVPRSQIAAKLGEIYNPYCVEWEVVTDANFADMSWDTGAEGLAVDGSGIFSTLTNEMLALNQVYRTARSIEPAAIYLFVLPKSETPGIEGDMPRGKQFGYLFANNDTDVMARTASHEIAHGLFLLQHPFNDYYGFAQGALPDNLMDYAGGEKLSKLQWDCMHDPGIVLGVFERDGDAMLAGMKWFTPEWKAFSFNSSHSVAGGATVPQGTVPGISYNGKSYIATFDAQGNFLGYKSGSDVLPITLHPQIASKDFVSLYQDNGECGTDKYYKTTYQYAVDNKTAINYSNNVNLTTGILINCTFISTTNSSTPTDIFNTISSQADANTATRLVMTQLATKPDKNDFTNKVFKVKQVLFITLLEEANSPDNLDFFNTYNTGSDKVLFWITFDKANNKVSVKEIKYPSVIQSKESELARVWEDIKKEPFHLHYILLYELSDLLSQGLEHLIIPSYVYDCKHEKYNAVYAKVFGYLNITKITTGLISFETAKLCYPPFATINNTVDQMSFAFSCGLYNGLVTVVKSVPDLVNFATSPFSPTGRAAIDNQVTSFKSLEIKGSDGNSICNPDEYSCKAIELLKSGVKDMFSNECTSAQTVGSIVGPIIVACLGDVAALTGELGAISNTLKTTLNFFKWCDKIGDVFTYVGKVSKAGLKLIKGPTGDLLVHLDVDGTNLIRQQGENLIVKQVRDGEIVEVTINKDQINTITKASLEDVLKIVKAGSKWFKFLDDPFTQARKAEVIASELPNRFPNLSMDELTAIRTYTSSELRNGKSIYSTLNESLRIGKLDDFNNGLNELLSSGLKKLPTHNGAKVYRGVGSTESNLAHTWVKNQDITFPDFKSTSTSMGKASKFLTGDVYYEILNPKGYNICDISCHPNELEILFPSNAKFKVKEIIDKAVMYDDAFEPIEAKKITLEYIGYE